MLLLLHLGFIILCVCVTHMSVISSTADINRTNWSGHPEEHCISDGLLARWTSATVLTSREPKATDWTTYVESAQLISITCYRSRSSANWTSRVRGQVRTRESSCNCVCLVTSSYISSVNFIFNILSFCCYHIGKKIDFLHQCLFPLLGYGG